MTPAPVAPSPPLSLPSFPPPPSFLRRQEPRREAPRAHETRPDAYGAPPPFALNAPLPLALRELEGRTPPEAPPC